MTGTGKARAFRGVFNEVHYVTPKEAFDSEALVGRAAWLLAATKNLPAKADLLSAHNAYMSAIKGQQRPGGTFSLRRYDPPSEWMR